MRLTKRQYPPEPWNPRYARAVGVIALLLPALGAFLYHADSFAEIGQARYIISVRSLLIAGGVMLMVFMPRAFRRILDRKSIADEHELYQRSRTYHTSYVLMQAVTVALVIIAALAINDPMSSREARQLLVTMGLLVVVYGIVIPFNILAWRMTPPDEE